MHKAIALSFGILATPALAEPTITMTQSELALVIEAQVTAYAAQTAARRAEAITRRINEAFSGPAPEPPARVTPAPAPEREPSLAPNP